MAIAPTAMAASAVPVSGLPVAAIPVPSIPVSSGASSFAPVSGAALQPSASRSRVRVVLVASADASLRERLRQSLTGLRWQVLEAPGGAEAWVASQSSSQLEALLIDPWLPDLDVTEFLRDFHRDHPQVDLMMTDGVQALESPRSLYHQELLYALRRSQDGDTAAWQAAPWMEERDERSVRDNRDNRRDLSELPPLGSGQGMALPVRQPMLASGQNAAQNASLRRTEVGPVEAGTVAIERSGVLSGSVDGLSPESIVVASGGLEVTNTAPTIQRRETSATERIPTLIGTSPAMLEVSRRIRLVAGRTTPVLIEGPTGSGKELVAEALHRLSSRSRKPFVAINCAAIPEALLEAELFGHTRGAFTGAVQGRLGRIESADGGTLFLDEIGEMPLALQSKLLRFFESGELQRIGDNETVKVDVRIVTATHQPLAEDTQKGNFRADLYYRLAVFLIRTPALAEHMEDLPALIAHFLERMARKNPAKRIDGSAMTRLAAHHWPGNVRELEHVLERAAILAGDEPIITAEEIDFGLYLMK